MSGGCSEEGSGLPRPLPWGQPGRRRRGAGRGEECWAARPAGAADQHHGQGPSGASRPGPGRAAGSGQREPGTGTWPPAGRGRTLRGGGGGGAPPGSPPRACKAPLDPLLTGDGGGQGEPSPGGDSSEWSPGGEKEGEPERREGRAPVSPRGGRCWGRNARGVSRSSCCPGRYTQRLEGSLHRTEKGAWGRQAAIRKVGVWPRVKG